MRHGSYRVDDRHLYLPRGIKVKCKGELRRGGQGRLEIAYDEAGEAWRGFYER